MADATGGGDVQPVYDERVVLLARKLLRNPTEIGIEPGDLDAACKVAQRMLEDSEERTNDPATTDHESDEVIRRTSSETSTSGDTQSRRSYQSPS